MYHILQDRKMDLPQILTNALKLFLKTEEAENSIELKGKEEATSMTQNIYKLIRAFIYYQPLLILTRMYYSWTIWFLSRIIDGLVALLPYLAGDNAKTLKFSVERLLGLLIGVISLMVGFDHEKVGDNMAKRKRKPFGTMPQDKIDNATYEQEMNANKAKFSCDLKIHQYEHAFDSFSAARQSVGVRQGNVRRMSASSDLLHHSYYNSNHLQSSSSSEDTLIPERGNYRRCSISPGTLESMTIPRSRHFSNDSAKSNRDIDALDTPHMHGHDAETRKMINEREPGDGDAFEDHSELLSMQVETYMDIK